MKVEIAVPVWGTWLEPFLGSVLPVLRAEAHDVGAQIVIYTDAGDSIRAVADEVRPLAASVQGVMDLADLAHADAIDRALAGDYVVCPLPASLIPGRGTLRAALDRIEAGKRGVMALTMTGVPPEPAMTAAVMSAWMGRGIGIGYWDERHLCSHPGHYGWRCGDAVLVRPIYIHPVLLRPTRRHVPTRAVDHFMTEGYLDHIDQVARLDPAVGLLAGLPQPSADQPGEPVIAEHMRTPEGIVAWMRGDPLRINAMPWNLHFMAHRFWLGEPGAGREAVETESDATVAELMRLYFAHP